MRLNLVTDAWFGLPRKRTAAVVKLASLSAAGARAGLIFVDRLVGFRATGRLDTSNCVGRFLG
jgi:hypothetical protein